MTILSLSGQTACLNYAGIAIGSTTTGVAIAASNGAGVDYAIDGKAFHKADAATISISATDLQADLTTCCYLIELDSSGNLTTLKGDEVLTALLGELGNTAQWPSPTADLCPIGGFKVATSGLTFTGGTTAFDASGITDTFFSFALGIPNTPEIT